VKEAVGGENKTATNVWRRNFSRVWRAFGRFVGRTVNVLTRIRGRHKGE